MFPSPNPRVDFVKEDFDTLVYQKGRPLILEKSLLCPCKSSGSNQQSNCKNCGGSGLIFVNPKEVRMVISSMNLDLAYAPWSQEMTGMINVTCAQEEKISIGDRLTFKNSESVFTEVLHFKALNDRLFSYTAYNINRIDYVGLFRTVDTTLKRLEENIDYTFRDNVLELSNSYYDPLSGNQDLSVTIRYIHHPQYMVIDIKRETMETQIPLGGGEILKRLPVSFMAKRTHYQLDAENLDKSRILDNSYPESSCTTTNQCQT